MGRDICRGGADAANSLTDAKAYRVVVSPRPVQFSYQYAQLRNLGFAIDQQREIQLARDRQRFFHQHLVHRLAVGRILIGHQLPAEQRSSHGTHVVEALHHFDAARLATPAGMDLRLDHPGLAAQFVGGIDRGIGTCRNDATWRVNVARPQYVFGLILVQVHCS